MAYASFPLHSPAYFKHLLVSEWLGRKKPGTGGGIPGDLWHPSAFANQWPGSPANTDQATKRPVAKKRQQTGNQNPQTQANMATSKLAAINHHPKNDHQQAGSHQLPPKAGHQQAGSQQPPTFLTGLHQTT